MKHLKEFKEVVILTLYIRTYLLFILYALVLVYACVFSLIQR